ncbi:MAG: M23 family metallopeptidase [Vicinamibacterales bacterium]
MNAAGRRPDVKYLLAAGLLGFVLGAFVVGSLGAGAPRRPRTALGATHATYIADQAPGPLATAVPTATSGTTGSVSAPQAHELEPADLIARHLTMPVEGVRPDQLVDSFHDAREVQGAHQHEAIDILAPRNTPVVAVEDGTIAKLFLSKAGGTTVYQFDPENEYCYYYAHLERYADGLKDGEAVHRGQVIGYVGTSGDAPKNTPHLHFAIFKLTAAKHWWQGTAIDPYNILR